MNQLNFESPLKAAVYKVVATLNSEAQCLTAQEQQHMIVSLTVSFILTHAKSHHEALAEADAIHEFVTKLINRHNIKQQ